MFTSVLTILVTLYQRKRHQQPGSSSSAYLQGDRGIENGDWSEAGESPASPRHPATAYSVGQYRASQGGFSSAGLATPAQLNTNLAYNPNFF